MKGELVGGLMVKGQLMSNHCNGKVVHSEW